MHTIGGAKENLIDIDVRVKILFLAGMLALVLSHDGVTFPLVVAALCVGTCLWLRVPAKVFMLRILEPLVLVAGLVILKGLSGGEPLISFAPFGLEFTFYKDGLQAGGMLALRLLAAVGLVTVISVSTPFVEFFSGLGWFRVPRTFIEVMMFAVRYVMMFFEEAQVIYKSQKNRLGYSSMRRSFNSFGILSGSLVIRAFDHSAHMTTALRQRGYDGRLPELEGKPFKAKEVAGAIVLISVMVVLWKLPLV